VNSAYKLVRNWRAIAAVSGLRTALAFTRAVLWNLPQIIRSRNLVAADLSMRGKAWPYTLQGVRLTLDGRFFGGAREMYCRQVYFPTPEFSLRPNNWVVDVGANAGLFTVLAASVGCKVLAVEAQAGFVRELEALSTEVGVREHIFVENALVGGESGIFSDARNLEKASHFAGIVPQTKSMDELLIKHGIEEVDFMKVDIEGSEFNLFRPNSSWMGKVNRLAMEVHPEHGDVGGLVATIASHDFHVELRDNDLLIVDSLGGAAGYLFATRAGSRRSTGSR
jgi:FkbM family methyltransferase